MVGGIGNIHEKHESKASEKKEHMAKKMNKDGRPYGAGKHPKLTVI
jgi:hypothetical protein